MITKDQLIAILPLSKKHIDAYFDPLCETLEYYGINTPIRMAAFIAQIGVESGQFKYVKELGSGNKYDRRLDLGNSETGDGERYKGRGLIQITGKNNYIALMMALGIDCVAHPEILEEPKNACMSAGWYWSNRNLNPLADSGSFTAITKKINGGLNGYTERYEFYLAAKKVLKC